MKFFAAVLLLLIAASAQAGPRLYVFDCGVLYGDDISTFGLSDDETPVRELFVPCYLIRHAEGLLFWDGGLPLSAAEAEGHVALDGGFSMFYARSVIDQLADMDITPADIRYAAYSHLHFDHAGAANALAGVEVLMQKAEWEAAFDGGGYVDTSLFDALRDAEMTLIEGDHDVFGDGSVQLIFTPGHTPGHQSLLVNLEETGPILLSGDLYHFRESRTLRRAPTFNHDAAMTFESMDKVESLLQARGATLWIEHDKALADTLRKAPEYYE